MEEKDIICLVDENGEEAEFEFIDILEYEGGEYAVLLPVAEDDDDVVILKVEPLDEEYDDYIDVEDEDTLKAVFELFKEKFEDEFYFTEGE